MKLNDKEFKELKSLLAAKKQGKLDETASARLEELLAKKKGANDPKWWDNYPDLTKDVINVPFNWIPGKGVRTVLPSGSTVSHTQFFTNVACVHYLPTIGRSVSSSDAFNAQMRQLWLDMHRKYRGIGTYQASDLGVVMLCVTGIFTLLSQFQRIYGLLNTYKIMNRSIPVAIYEALQIDPSLAENMADFRYFLNSRIERLRQLCLPKGIAAINAEIVNNTFIYKDSENPRSSLFLFNSYSVYQYDATTITTGGCAKAIDLTRWMNGSSPSGDDGFTLNDIITCIDDNMNALLNDDDVAKMCSDLIAAYGPENVITLGYVPEDYRLEPVYDYEKLVQFHNVKFAGMNVGFVVDNTIMTAADASSMRGNGIRALVYQKDDVLYQEFSTGSTYVEDTSRGRHYLAYSASLVTSNTNPCPPADQVIIDTWVDKPDKIELLCGTRYTVCADRERTIPSSPLMYTQYISSFGLCIPLRVVLVGTDGNGDVFSYALNGTDFKVASLVGSINDAFLQLSKFDWHPLLNIYDISGGTIKTYGDLDNFTVITSENLARIHDVACYSAFKIPNVAYIN